MRLVIAKIGNSPRTTYAQSELCKYLKMIDPCALIEKTVYDSYDADADNVIFVGMLDETRSDDDRVQIKVKNGAGYITGSNERSVLIAVYKFLESLGCKWIRPSEDGEFIPKRKLSFEDVTFELDQTPSYRHRGICMEGGVTYESVYDIINWLPKVGMNEYFVQFHNPWCFFNNWKKDHAEIILGQISKEDTARITKCLEEEIELRGLSYHKVGHGWTYPLVGKEGSGWCKYDGEVPDDVKALFAEVNGQKDLWNGSLFDTNLCYSDPEARRRFTDGIANYCKNNPHVDYLHFWLADARNNQCECDECKKLLPSDYYVMMLNELDEKLTAMGVQTKIVFLLYLELLWAPSKMRINNPDRFTMMFAPITRSYKKSYQESLALEGESEPYEYVRNKIELPESASKNVAFLSKWQEQFKGDSFVFDYHMMWDYQIDPGAYRNARVLFDDMKNLDKLGLDGMVSCQVQKASVPTCLSMYGMAKALWDKSLTFEEMAGEYFEVSFDRDAEKVQTYLKKLSEYHDSDTSDKYEKIIAEIDGMISVIKSNLNSSEENSPCYMSWMYLLRHAEYLRIIEEGLLLKSKGDKEGALKKKEECEAFLWKIEPDIERGMDVYEFTHVTLKYGGLQGVGLVDRIM